MKNSIKRSLLVVAAFIVAIVTVFAQANDKKLYKNGKEKEEIVTAILKDEELKSELMHRMMKNNKEGCSMMMGNEKMMKMCSKMMDNEDMEGMMKMCSKMMAEKNNRSSSMCGMMMQKDKN
jgi:hypothetical protein